MPTNAIEVRQLSHAFDKTLVLRDVSFSLASGELVSIIGPSGSGKTVLLKLLSGLIAHESGGFKFDPADAAVSVAFQSAPLFPWMSVEENLRICMGHRYKTAAEATQVIHQLLQKAKLEKFSGYFPKELSGGMQQKVNILRAFSTGANIILMDEPFVHLDYLQRHVLQDFTREIWEGAKKSILFVTHDIDEALYLSDRILVFSESPGSIIRELNVPFAHPRDRIEIRKTTAYGELFKEISEKLQNQ